MFNDNKNLIDKPEIECDVIDYTTHIIVNFRINDIAKHKTFINALNKQLELHKRYLGVVPHVKIGINYFDIYDLKIYDDYAIFEFYVLKSILKSEYDFVYDVITNRKIHLFYHIYDEKLITTYLLYD